MEHKRKVAEASKKKFAKPLAELEYKTFLLEQEMREYQPTLDKILAELEVIELKDKIPFLKRKKQEYISNLSMATLASSGTIAFNGMELFMDREITNIITELEQNVVIPVKDITKQLWFKVALLFANGSMNKLKKDLNSNATAIAKRLGNKNLRPYISESIAKRSETDKNIFYNNDRLLLIKRHCEENNIPICEDFLKCIKPE